jgi:hypothetical protein
VLYNALSAYDWCSMYNEISIASIFDFCIVACIISIVGNIVSRNNFYTCSFYYFLLPLQVSVFI